MSSIVSKPSSRNKSASALTIAFAVVGVAYPFAVYFARDMISPRGFVAVALILLGLRLIVGRSDLARSWRTPLLTAGIVLLISTFLSPAFAEKAYPALMSLAAASVFAWSLRHPPSLIERFARLTVDALPPEGQIYCRNVTIIWVLWLTANAVISAALALWGSLAVWTLWTGLISYVVAGTLFVGEICFRHLIHGYRPNT